MALPITFATLATGNQPAADLDTNFNAVGAMAITQCVITGTNSLALTQSANQPNVTAYNNTQLFGGVAANTSTSSLNASVNSIGSIPVYRSDGVAAGANDIVAGIYYLFAYNSSLNAGLGGLQIVNSSLIDDFYSLTAFTTTGTFTTSSISSTSTVYRYRMLGGGGGGGGANGIDAIGGGGGAGEYAEGFFTGVAASTAIAITIGAAGTAGTTSGSAGGTGGTTTIGTPVSITCIGGDGGGGSTSSASTVTGGGAGGTGGTGSPVIRLPGGQGGNGFFLSGQVSNAGSGANSPFGSGGIGRAAAGAGILAPTAAIGQGAGGGGGGGATSAGTVGTGGIVIIEQMTP